MKHFGLGVICLVLSSVAGAETHGAFDASARSFTSDYVLKIDAAESARIWDRLTGVAETSRGAYRMKSFASPRNGLRIVCQRAAEGTSCTVTLDGRSPDYLLATDSLEGSLVGRFDQALSDQLFDQVMGKTPPKSETDRFGFTEETRTLADTVVGKYRLQILCRRRLEPRERNPDGPRTVAHTYCRGDLNYPAL